MTEVVAAPRRALVIGNSDGIGRELVRQLIDDDWHVTGLSRSASDDLPADAHVMCDVTAADYRDVLTALTDRRGPFDVCIYCVGTGEAFTSGDLTGERSVFSTNLLAAVETAEVIVPRMVAVGHGHFLGLSSLADAAPNPGAPSYSASKAGLTSWLEGIGLALKPYGIAVTVVRFGFVDTKLAEARWKPFLITRERAARYVMKCLRTRPLRASHPRFAALAMHAVSALMALRIWFG